MEEKSRPFETHAECYELWFENNEVAYRSELKAVDEFLPSKGKGIDIGVGSGRFSEPFSIQYGIDPSREMLKIADSRGIQVVQGVGEDMPFQSSSFDFASIVTTICFFDDPLSALKESFRILKSDGMIIIGFVDKNSSLGKKYRRRKDQNVFYKEAEFYSVDEVTEFLTEAGFSNLEYYQTLFQYPDSLEEVEEPEVGYGEGSFVVVKGYK